jgi:anti-sigma B factor antagonist
MPDPAVPPVLWTHIHRPLPGLVVVKCRGRLVSGEADNLLYNTVKEIIPTAHRVVLDLEELEYTDSMGLGTLVRLYVRGKSVGCRVELMHLNKQIQNLLGIAGLFEVFSVVGENTAKLIT